MSNRLFLSLRLLVLFLGFSYVLSSTAVSATRSLKSSNNENPSSSELTQDEMDLSDSEEIWVEQLGYPYPERRMDFESTDYPGTGANNHHDPKTPGRA